MQFCLRKNENLLLLRFMGADKTKMIDVTRKGLTFRSATAYGKVVMKEETLGLILDKKIPKGDVLEVARVAGILAGKETSKLIPMCHPIAITNIDVDYKISQPNTIEIYVKTSAVDRTGVEMEALTAVAITALTIYDMCKSVEREITISDIKVLEKSGGKTGDFKRHLLHD
jgi:cyclic pyranopterin phosphate synthase